MIKKHRLTPVVLLAAVCLALSAACGGGGEQAAGPAEGSAEWYWEAAQLNVEKGDFAKAQEQLEEVAKSESELAGRASLWREVLLYGLAEGLTDVTDAYRASMELKPATIENYQNAVQQHDRRAKGYSIALAESLGQLDKAIGDGKVTLDFPFPSGSAVESPVLAEVAGGVVTPPDKLAPAEDHAVRRQMILGAALLAGTGEDSAKAQAMFNAGPFEVDAVIARAGVARQLLNLSDLYERKRLMDAKLRTLFIERSEQWFAPVKELEDDEEMAELVKDYEFALENERRDMAGKRRRKK